MKKIFRKSCFFLILSLCITKLLGQTKIPDNTGLPFWYTYNQERADKIGLPLILNSGKVNYCRMWDNDFIISYAMDIYPDKDSSTKGFITLYTEEIVDENKESPTKRVYSKSIVLKSNQADSIYQLLQTLHIASLPTDTLIKGWQNGIDGITYNFEWLNQSAYTYKSYWQPNTQGSLEEAKKLQYFIERVGEIAQIKELKNEFKEHIPFENYGTSGGVRVAIRALTVEQRRKYRKERDAYRKKHKIKI